MEILIVTGSPLGITDVARTGVFYITRHVEVSKRSRCESESGHKKCLVCLTPIVSVKDAIARISVTAGWIRGMSRILENVRDPTQNSCTAC
ncbi:hypothetical protein TNCV_4029741 [Trichonephila clavipes]|nr:hypothetical protein TNCV_4029741 [Trichonephila clavipes]